MQPVENKTQTETVIHMDDKIFINCAFTRCQMVYSGGDFAWANTIFKDCRVTLEGPAKRTAEFLNHFNLFRAEAFGKAAPPPSSSSKEVN